MQKWNWFLAADYEGRWITTHGYAEVSLEANKLNASLLYDPDFVYHHVIATIDWQSNVEAFITSPGRDTAPFELNGQLFKGAAIDGVETMTVLLTDGTTVLGMAYGPRSDEISP